MVEKGSGQTPGIRVAAAALAVSAVLVFLPGWASGASGDGDSSADLTFEGPAEQGGTISITTTADHTGIVRAEADAVEFRLLPPTGPAIETTFSRTLYFQPPASITDGHFEFGLPGSLAGMVRGAASIEGTLLTDTEAAGTATYVICMVGGCSDAGQVDWTAEGPVDTPPGPDDVAYYPTLEGSEGSLVLTMDPSGEGVTSLGLKGVSFEPCIPGDNSVSIRMFFEPPEPLEASPGGLVQLVQLSTGLHLIRFDGARLDGRTLAGAVALVEAPYGDCSATIRWTTGAFPTATETATLPTSTASPVRSSTPPPTPGASQLPAAGAGRGQPSPLAPLIVVGCLLSLATVVAAGAVWRLQRG